MQIQTRPLAGIPFAVTTLSEASTALCNFASQRGAGADVHLLNAYSVALAERDEKFRGCVISANCNLPDGKPLSVLTSLSRERLGQVRGPSFFEKVMDEGRALDLRHYLLGSTPDTLAALKTSLEARYSGVNIVGTMSPPFGPVSAAELAEQDRIIALSNPHVVWVGLGTPKQDFEVQRLARENGFVAVAVGAAFDFSAGTKREAPSWIQKVGAEWLYRFGTEPRRLWKRYLVGNFLFIWAVIRPRNLY